MSRKVTAIFLLFVLLLSGCTLNEEKLLPQIEKKIQKMHGYYAELQVVVFSFEGEQAYIVKQWQEFPSRWRVEIETSDGLQYFICDGKQIWVYEPGIDDYFRLDVRQNSGELAPPFMLSGYLEKLRQADHFEFAGKKVMNGNDYYVVNYPGQMQGESVRLWLNQDSLFPEHIQTYLDGEPLNHITTRTFEANPQFPSGLFEFAASAEHQVTSQCLFEPLSLDEAKLGWPAPVFLPSFIPEGTSLYVISRVIEETREQLIFVYNGQKHFTLIQYPIDDSATFSSSKSREVRIGNRTGIYHENSVNDLATLCWANDSSEFILTGSLTLTELVSIAGSLKPDET